MIKGQRQRALELTQGILKEYWAGRRELLYQYLDEEVLWVGPLETEYIRGAAEVREYLEKEREEFPEVFLDQQEYEIVSNDAKSCAVAGRYHAYTAPDSDTVWNNEQRVTALWKYEEKELRIVHLHISNIVCVQDGEAGFPIQAGRESYEYLQMLLTQRNQSAVLAVKDCSGVTRVLNYTDILYIRPAHNYSVIICMEGDKEIRVRQTLTELLAILPDNFCAVSRSCLVNLNYVSELEARSMLLIDGTRLKVPERNKPEIKRRLLGKKNKNKDKKT